MFHICYIDSSGVRVKKVPKPFMTDQFCTHFTYQESFEPFWIQFSLKKLQDEMH